MGKYNTKITIHQDNPTGSEREYSITLNWDCSMEDLYDAFRSLALAMGYHPDTVEEYFDI